MLVVSQGGNKLQLPETLLFGASLTFLCSVNNIVKFQQYRTKVEHAFVYPCRVEVAAECRLYCRATPYASSLSFETLGAASEWEVCCIFFFFFAHIHLGKSPWKMFIQNKKINQAKLHILMFYSQSQHKIKS